MIKVLLNAGHGGGVAHNRGALYYNEGDNNFHYSLILKKELETYQNIIVDLVRKNINDNPALAERSAMGKGYDLYFGIHSNAFKDSKVRGTEVWDSVEKPNKILAQAICDATAKIFNHDNRGVGYKVGQPNYNYYGELRFNQAKSAMIIENGFHTNPEDCLFFKNNHLTIAKIQAKVIADHYRLNKKTATGTLIISKPTATLLQMQEWAKSKKANQEFIDLASTFYRIGVQSKVNPIVLYAQSAKETGYMKFGGVLDKSYYNPCGMKTTKGGGDYDKNAHHRFKSWQEGIQAQTDHLLIYCGFITPNTPDPRHFPYLAKTPIRFVEELSGKWSPSPTYGQEIIKLVKEIENTKTTTKPKGKLFDGIKKVVKW